MKIKISILKKAFHSFFFLIMLILLCQCFYLYPYSIGNLAFYDIPIVLFVCYSVLICLKYINKDDFKKMSFLLPTVMVLVSIAISAFTSYLNFHQSIITTLLQQRNYYIFALAYIPTYLLFKRNLIDIKSIGNIIIILGITEFLIYGYQALNYPSIIILNCKISIRYFTRLYVDSVVIESMIFISLSRMLDNSNKKIKFKYLIPIIIGFIHVAFISQGRLETTVCLLTCFLSILLWKRVKSLKWVIFAIVTVVTIILINNNGIFELFLSQNDTLSIRVSGRALFMSQLLSDPLNLLFGIGYPYDNYARMISGITQGIAVNDNGFIGYMYLYGVFGIITILIYLIRGLKQSVYIWKNNGSTFPLMFLFFNIGISYTITFWWWKPEWTFLLGCFFAYIECEYKKRREIK